MRLLPSGTTIEGFADTEPDRLVDVVREARDYCELVLLDTPAGVSRETLLPIHVADDVVVVSTPRVSAVRDAKKTIELAERVNSSTAGLVLTHTGSGSAPPGEDIAEFLGIRLLGSIPVDGAVTESQDRGRAVVSAAPDSPAAKAYRRTLDRLADRIGSTGREHSRTEMEPDL